MLLGVASMTLTGTTLPSSPKTRVIPSLLPINPAGTASLGPRSHLDFDVDACSQAQAHQRIHGLGRRVDDVDQPLVGPDLELLSTILVHERAADDGVLLDPCRQRNRPRDGGTGPLRRLHDLLGRLVEQLVVVRLEPNADALFGHRRISPSAG